MSSSFYPTATETVTATTVVVPEYLNEIAASVASASEKFVDLINRVPGGEILLSYIRYSYQDDPYRSVFELLLLIFAIVYFLKSKSSYSKKDYVKLSKKEIDELVQDWQPEPLVLPLAEQEEWQLDAIPVIQGECKTHSNLIIDKATGETKEVINLASLNYLDLTSKEEIKESGIEQMHRSGVGACGPPNFYGTQDAHIRLEEDLARFFGAEKAILYAQDFATSQSIIPCFLKRGDIAVVDGGVSLAIQKAVKISRCEVYWYDHNDINSLESVLKNLNEELKDEELTRRFIITEGLFENSGDIPDLAKIVEIKNQYKYRLILEESRSIGVLGKTGRGLVEHCNVERGDIDITMGSLAQALASSGGFCIGEAPMINHQKLQSNAYVFSAALPPYCAQILSKAMQIMEETPIVSKLQHNIDKFYSIITTNKNLSKYVEVVSKPESPTIHLRLSSKLRESLELPFTYGGPSSEILMAVKKGLEANYLDENYNQENYLLQTLIDKIVKSGILIARSQRILHHEILPLIPELLITINAGLSDAEIEQSCQLIVKDITSVLSRMTLKKFDSLL